MFGFGKVQKSSEALAVLVERGEFDTCLREIKTRAADLAAAKAKFARYLDLNKREGIIDEKFLPVPRATLLDALLAAAVSPQAMVRPYATLGKDGELHRMATALANHQPNLGVDAIEAVPPKVAELNRKGIKGEALLKHIDLLELTEMNATHLDKFKAVDEQARKLKEHYMRLLTNLTRAAVAKKGK